MLRGPSQHAARHDGQRSKRLLQSTGDFYGCRAIPRDAGKGVVEHIPNRQLRHLDAVVCRHCRLDVRPVPGSLHMANSRTSVPMTSIAVPGSLTAGESARLAISESTISPNRGSSSKTRASPIRNAFAIDPRSIPDVSPDSVWTRARTVSGAAKVPGSDTTDTRASAASAQACSAPMSTRCTYPTDDPCTGSPLPPTRSPAHPPALVRHGGDAGPWLAAASTLSMVLPRRPSRAIRSTHRTNVTMTTTRIIAVSVKSANRPACP